MFEVGSRTKTTATWLLGEDEDAFDVLVRASFPDARWRCSQLGPLGLRPVHLHQTVADAMACGRNGIQTFLDLPIGGSLPDTVGVAEGVTAPTGPPVVAMVQLHRSRRYQHQGTEVHLAGRLATTWNERDIGSELQALLTQQRQVIWSALTRSTRPAHLINEYNGSPVNGRRIGPAAHAETLRTAMPLADPGMWRLRLT